MSSHSGHEGNHKRNPIRECFFCACVRFSSKGDVGIGMESGRERFLQCKNPEEGPGVNSRSVGRSPAAWRQPQGFARFGERTLTRSTSPTLLTPAARFLLRLGNLPAFLSLLRPSRSLALDLETQIWPETAPVDLDAQVMQVPQFVVHRLGPVLLGAKAALELVEYGLTLRRRYTCEIPCGHLALIRRQAARIDQQCEPRLILALARVLRFCCCSFIYITTTTHRL